MHDKKTLRRELKETRNALSARAQVQASRSLLGHLLGLRAMRRAKRIAAYWPQGGEMSPGLVLQDAHLRGKTCFLPMLHPFSENRLWFLRWQPGLSTTFNKYGITEPKQIRSRMPALSLDIVLLPLVGFDDKGNRLGLGGGYYDRTFAYTNRQNHWKRPLLIGIAHACQQTTRLTAEPWDIGLDAVVTDQKIHVFNSRIR